MENLWIIFKCLSLITGCLLMLAIIVAIVETIREKFNEAKFKKELNYILLENIKNNINKEEE